MVYAQPLNISGIDGMFSYANSVTNNYFGMGIVISLFIIIFFHLKARDGDTSESIVASGYITSIFAVLCFFLNIISGKIMLIIIAFTAIGTLWNLFTK